MEFDSISPTDDTMCLAHIHDPHLLQRLTGLAEAGRCTVCVGAELQPSGQVVNLEHLARCVEDVAPKRYDNEGAWFEGEQWLTPLDNIEMTAELLQDSIDSEALDYTSSLTGTLLSNQLDWYETSDSWYNESEWNEFEHTVKHITRTVVPTKNSPPESPAERNFHFMESMLVLAREEFGIVKQLAKGTMIYRARVARESSLLATEARNDPAGQLGPAPEKNASAGRMNAQGIPLFYAALEAETACAEVVSHSPYDEAVVGAFTTRCPLRILDLTLMPRKRSIFDDTYEDGDRHLDSFRYYADRITRPIILDENHPTEYAPTQILTEFLRWSTEPRLDGIKFSSRVQEGGANLVLFFGDKKWFQTTDFAEPDHDRSQTLDHGKSDEAFFSIDPSSVKRYRVRRQLQVSPMLY